MGGEPRIRVWRHAFAECFKYWSNSLRDRSHGSLASLALWTSPPTRNFRTAIGLEPKNAYPHLVLAISPWSAGRHVDSVFRVDGGGIRDLFDLRAFS